MSNGKKVCTFLEILFLFVSASLFSPVFAQTDPISSTNLLQTTTGGIPNEGPIVWQNMLPIDLQPNQNVLPLDINHLTIVNDPSHILFLPTSNINPQSSAINQSALLQPSTSTPIQETSSSLMNQLFSSNTYTFPATHGEITINTASQTLTNKTISGQNNTFQNIPNSSLVNASIRLIGGSGISITGGDVALGGIVTIANTASTAASDILAATQGTIDNVSIGDIIPDRGKFTTINGLTIDNNGGNILNIAAGKTLNTMNSLTFSGTDGTTLTFPSGSDTLAGLTTVQTLTNKTFTSPTINGTVSTTGLTLPAFISSGTITGSGNTTITNFGSIDGLTIFPNATGFSLSGGTSAKTLTVNNTIALAAGADNQTFTFPSGSGMITVLGNTTTGAGSLVLASSPTLTTPTIGAATATSINGLTLSATTGVLTIANGKTLNASNSLALSDTDGSTLTFQGTDTYIGRTTTDTLTNKTLTAPSINGTVTTTGLTLPTFIATGTITGSGSPTITNFGSINGLTLASSTDGFILTGGTTPRALTMTGTDLTLGSIIKPTNSGALAIQSNGANALTLDSGGNAGISIGATNANAITLGTDATVSANKTFSVTSADKLTVGGTIIPQSIPIPVPLTATIVTQPVFIADTTYQVIGAKCIPSVLSLSGNFQVTVDSGTTTAGGGTSQLSSAISLTGVANTVLSGTLIGSPTTINVGDRVSVKFGGLLTGLLGTCTIYLKRV